MPLQPLYWQKIIKGYFLTKDQKDQFIGGSKNKTNFRYFFESNFVGVNFFFFFGYKNNKDRTFFPKSGQLSSNLTIKQKIDMRNIFKNIISTATSKKIVKLKYLKRLNQGATLSYFR